VFFKEIAEHLLLPIRLQYMVHAWSHGSQGKLSVFDVNDNWEEFFYF
jgi:hypothetical protein